MFRLLCNFFIFWYISFTVVKNHLRAIQCHTIWGNLSLYMNDFGYQIYNKRGKIARHQLTALIIEKSCATNNDIVHWIARLVLGNKLNENVYTQMYTTPASINHSTKVFYYVCVCGSFFRWYHQILSIQIYKHKSNRKHLYLVQWAGVWRDSNNSHASLPEYVWMCNLSCVVHLVLFKLSNTLMNGCLFIIL